MFFMLSNSFSLHVLYFAIVVIFWQFIHLHKIQLRITLMNTYIGTYNVCTYVQCLYVLLFIIAKWSCITQSGYEIMDLQYASSLEFLNFRMGLKCWIQIWICITYFMSIEMHSNDRHLSKMWVLLHKYKHT